MFCPQCSSEYRAGFTRCADCDVDLVERLPEKPAATPAATSTAAASCGSPGTLVDYCGFFALEEAREARDRLRAAGIRPEIAVRERPDADLAVPAEEEYWLRFPVNDAKRAASLLSYDEGGTTISSDPVACSSCGRAVAAEETFCPHCGARFSN